MRRKLLFTIKNSTNLLKSRLLLCSVHSLPANHAIHICFGQADHVIVTVIQPKAEPFSYLTKIINFTPNPKLFDLRTPIHYLTMYLPLEKYWLVTEATEQHNMHLTPSSCLDTVTGVWGEWLITYRGTPAGHWEEADHHSPCSTDTDHWGWFTACAILMRTVATNYPTSASGLTKSFAKWH